MGFYDLPKKERVLLVEEITRNISEDLLKDKTDHIFMYFSDSDTYIRKSGYLVIGKLYKSDKRLRPTMLGMLKRLMESDNEKIRQTTVNAAGEIGIIDFSVVVDFFNRGLFDAHHSVRNAVIGSVKKMGQKNPAPVLTWAKQYLKHPDKEIRREVCHGIELRGRTHPQDILPMLGVLQNDKTARVRDTLVHVLGQISYKKGCLQTVILALNKWKNKELVTDALDEIVDVHHRYRNFAVLTQKEAIAYIDENYKG